MSEIDTWMLVKKLKQNMEKTQFIIFSSRNKIERMENAFGDLVIDGVTIKPVRKVKYLGVFLDSYMEYSDHISEVIKRCNYAIFNLKNVKKFVSRETLKILVRTLVVSHIDYCNIIFIGITLTQQKRLSTMLNKCVRFIYSITISMKMRISPLMRELHWLPIEKRVKFKTCVLVHIAVKVRKPKYLNEYFFYSENLLNVKTRSASEAYLSVPKRTQERCNRMISHSGPRIYNELPSAIRNIDSLDTFKIHLKSYFFNN